MRINSPLVLIILCGWSWSHSFAITRPTQSKKTNKQKIKTTKPNPVFLSLHYLWRWTLMRWIQLYPTHCSSSLALLTHQTTHQLLAVIKQRGEQQTDSYLGWPYLHLPEKWSIEKAENQKLHQDPHPPQIQMRGRLSCLRTQDEHDY